MVNDKSRLRFPAGRVNHLPHTMSNHCPLLINTDGESIHNGNSKFKFEAWWLMEDTCEKIIKESWESGTGPVAEKLEKLQADLLDWARRIKKGREGLKKKLAKQLELLMEKEMNDNTTADIVDTKIHLNMEINKDEIYWEQRARANWLKVGDKNTIFFPGLLLLEDV